MKIPILVYGTALTPEEILFIFHADGWMVIKNVGG
jgi:hypothetical protein